MLAFNEKFIIESKFIPLDREITVSLRHQATLENKEVFLMRSGQKNTRASLDGLPPAKFETIIDHNILNLISYRENPR